MTFVAFCLLERKLQYSHDSAVFTFGFLFAELGITVAFAHAVLAYPTGRLRTSFERWFIGVSYAVVLGFSFALLAVWDHTQTCIWTKHYCAGPRPRSDPRLALVAAQFRAPLVLMHMRGNPRTMQKPPFAREVLRDVTQGLRRSIAVARKAGVAKSQIAVDPGIGFFRRQMAAWHAWDCQVLSGLSGLRRLGRPICVGVSRKSFIGAVAGVEDPAGRLPGMMSALTGLLGARCSTCHVAGNFASDELAAKQTARRHFAMQAMLNRDYFADRNAITCLTCHHGHLQPPTN